MHVLEPGQPQMESGVAVVWQWCGSIVAAATAATYHHVVVAGGDRSLLQVLDVRDRELRAVHGKHSDLAAVLRYVNYHGC